MTSKKVHFGKKVLNTLLVTKMMKKPNHFISCFQTWVLSEYLKSFDDTKYMYFLIENEKCWKHARKYRIKFSNMMQKRFDSRPKHNEKYLKMSYGYKISTNLHNNRMSKEGSHSVFCH